MTPPPPIRLEEILAQAGWVRALARRLAQDAQSAEDLSQGALAAAIERPPSSDKPLKPWLARVVTNLARKERRGDARRAERERRHAPTASSVPATDQLMAEVDEQRRIAHLVAELREPYRSVLLLHYYRDRTSAEIARELGLSAATVRSQLARGLALLRERVAARHDGDPRRTLGAFLLAAGESATPPITAGVATAATKILLLEKLIVMKSSTQVLAAGLLCGLVVTGVLTFGLFDSDDPASPDAGASLEPSLAEVSPERSTPTPTANADSGAREQLADAAATEAPAAEPEPQPAPAEIGPTTFTARALDGDGQPISGAAFQVVDVDGVPRDLGESDESGADGRASILLPKEAFFTYMGRDVSNVHMSLWAPGCARHFFVPGAKRGTTKDLGDITLELGGSVAGRVVDEGGVPVEGAVVVGTESWAGVEEARVSGPDREGGRASTTTDARGQYQLDGLVPGATLVWAGTRGKLWSVSDELTVPAAATMHGVELVLEPLPAESSIRGLVVGPAGAGVPDAKVFYGHPGSWSEEMIQADATGAFLIPSNREGSFRLMATDPEERLGQSAETLAQVGDQDVRLLCPDRRVLHVRVIDEANGAPIEAAAVIALPTEENSHFMNGRFLKSDANGLLEVPTPGDSFRINAGHTDFVYRQFGPFEPSALPEELLVELTQLPMIAGVVLHEGEPVEGAIIELWESCEDRYRPLSYGLPQRLSNGGIQKAVSDEQGHFRIATNDDAQAAPVLMVEKEGFALTELELTVPEPTAGLEDVEVHMIAGGALRGRVTVGPKRSPESVVVLISRGDSRPKFTRPDANGDYLFEGLTPGAWRVEDRDAEPEGRVHSMAQGDEHPFRWDCEVQADQTTEYDLDLRWQDDLRVAGRLSFDGAGAAGWTAVLEAPDHADRPWVPRPVTLGEEGDFSLEARPGYAKLVLRAPPDAALEIQLVRMLLIDQHHGPQLIALQSAGIEGTLPEGALKLRLHHRIDPSTHIEAVFSSDEGGRFSVQGFAAGSASFQNSIEGPYGLGWYGRGTVELEAGATTQVE